MWLLSALACCSPCDTEDELTRSEVDEEGRVSGLEHYQREGELDRLETNTCDAEGRVVAIDESWGGDGQVDERIEYSYDSRDRVIQEWHANRWGTKLADYTWDDEDRLATEHRVEDDEADGVVDEVSEYEWAYSASCVD